MHVEHQRSLSAQERPISQSQLQARPGAGFEPVSRNDRQVENQGNHVTVKRPHQIRLAADEAHVGETRTVIRRFAILGGNCREGEEHPRCHRQERVTVNCGPREAGTCVDHHMLVKQTSCQEATLS